MLRFVIVLTIIALVGAIIAKRKGRNPLIWFILSGICPFFIVVIALLPPIASIGYTKKCFYCAEIIKEDARLCKHCNKEQPIDMVRVSVK